MKVKAEVEVVSDQVKAKGLDGGERTATKWRISEECKKREGGCFYTEGGSDRETAKNGQTEDQGGKVCSFQTEKYSKLQLRTWGQKLRSREEIRRKVLQV